MPTPTPETPSTPAVPVWLATARRFYAQGFEVRTDAQMAGSVADWAELPVHEQTFTCAHLLYLNLVAQRGTQRLLEQVLGALDEVADALAGFEEPEGEDADDEDQPPDPTPAAASPPPATTPPTPAVEVEVLNAEDDSPTVEVEVLDAEDDNATTEEDAAA
ncbi:hypothetical protein L6R50_26745 [Myxococcota bacterium]|nr:hypothetical protein [Myxococcota bacterium]